MSETANTNTTPSAQVLASCRGLCVGHAGRAILPSIDLKIRQGEFWAVIGRNGSGKTTWLKTLLGLQPPIEGRVELRSHLRVSYLPQRSNIDELYPLLTEEVVSMGVLRGWSFLGRQEQSDRDRAQQALTEMDVADLARRPFRQLSEGQKQRVLFARLAASQAELAVLDEPTSAMDLVAEREALLLLDELRRRHQMALLVVSHFLGVAREFADQAILLDRDAQAVVVGSPAEVLQHPSFHKRYSDSVRPPAP